VAAALAPRVLREHRASQPLEQKVTKPSPFPHLASLQPPLLGRVPVLIGRPETRRLLR